MENRIVYVGISGKKRAGKDTFAGFLKDHLLRRHVSAMRRGFADAIRDEVGVFLCRELAGSSHWPNDPVLRMQKIMDHLTSFDPAKKEPFRLLMQWWGTEFRRDICGDDYWIRSLERVATIWLNLVPPDEKLVVLIPDVRMRNEAAFVRQHNGLLIRIVRPGMESQDTHATETALDDFDDWDALVSNHGSLNVLQKLALDWHDQFQCEGRL